MSDGRGRHLQVPRDADEVALEAGDNSSTLPRALSTDVDPWERQPDESEPAWEAFKAYREMGRERSQVRVAAQVGKNVNLISRWSKRWSWIRRAYEYELLLDRRAREETMREIGAMARRHAQQSQLFQATLTLPATALMQRVQRDPGFVERLLDGCEDVDASGRRVLNTSRTLDVMETIRKFAEAFPKVAQIERLARGEPTDISEGRGTAATTHDTGRAMYEDAEATRLAMELYERLEAQRTAG